MTSGKGVRLVTDVGCSSGPATRGLWGTIAAEASVSKARMLAQHFVILVVLERGRWWTFALSPCLTRVGGAILGTKYLDPLTSSLGTELKQAHI